MSFIRQPFRYQNNGAAFWIIGINFLIFGACYFFGREFYSMMLEHFAMIPALVIVRGYIWTFATYMFMHGGFTHVLFNMLGLLFFGIHVERQMGSKEFTLYYFVTGILAGVFSFGFYLLTNSPGAILIGASGAVFAVELAYAVFFPRSIIYIWGIIPLPAPVMVIGFTVLELFFSVTGMNPGVAHFTHLAGFAFGWLYFLIRFGVDPLKRLLGR